MTEAQAIETLAARWKASWEALQPTVPYALGNEAQPTAGVVTFANMMLSGPIATRQLTQGPIGSRKFERRGAVAVKLFGSVDVGDSTLALLVGDVKTTLESQPLGNAGDLLYTSSCATTAAKQGSWYTRMVTIPFTFYETR